MVALVATAHRAEDPNTRDAAPASQCQQFSALGLDQWMHGRQCSHLAPPRAELRVLRPDGNLGRPLCGGNASDRNGSTRAISGPHDYEQVPALIERSTERVRNLFADMDARLAESVHVAGEQFSVADITLLVTVDFAAKAIGLAILDEQLALQRWYERVSQRPSTAA